MTEWRGTHLTAYDAMFVTAMFMKFKSFSPRVDNLAPSLDKGDNDESDHYFILAMGAFKCSC